MTEADLDAYTANSIIYEAPDTNRDVIVRYIVSEGTINPSADDNWSFAPLPGTSAVFETGARAKDFIAQVKSLKIENERKQSL